MGKTISIKKAILLTAIAKYFKVISNLIFTIILARLLTPNDYGIVAIYSVFLNFFCLFSDMGVSAAIIQNKRLNLFDYEHIFSFLIYVGILLYILFTIFLYGLSVFYDNDIYFKLSVYLSFILFFSTLNMVPNALLLKNKCFVNTSIRAIVTSLFGGVVTVYLAYINYGVYSIVIGNLFSCIIVYLWNEWTVKLKFHWKINFISIKKIFAFSIYEFANNFILYFLRNLDNLLAGKIMGAISLGYYNKAFMLSQYPISMISNVIAPVLHPFFSEYQNDIDQLYQKHLCITKIFLMIGIPLSEFVYIASNDLVMIMYGSGWELSASCLMWFGLSIAFQLAASCISVFFKCLGDTKELFKSTLLCIFINAFAIIFGLVSHDIVVLSQAVSISYVLQFFVYNIYLIRFCLKKTLAKFLNDIRFLIADFFVLIIVCSYINEFICSCIYYIIIKFIVVLIATMFLYTVTGDIKFIKKYLHR